MIIRHRFIVSLSAIILTVFISPNCFAQVLPCPDHNKIPDFNCDGSVKVVVLGDSLVVGFGDTVNNNRGGYVLRAQNKLSSVEVLNRGDLGQRTFELIKDTRDALISGTNPQLRSELESADIVVLDLGRNDRWLFGEPIATYRNLKRIRKMITSKVTESVGVAPLVVTAVLMLPNRGSQGPWVKDLNQYILKGSSLAAPSDLRFDLVSKRLLASDQIHPTSEGYSALAKVFVSYLTTTLPKRMRRLRPDLDASGVPDIFEGL